MTQVRCATIEDAEDFCRIYNYYVRNTNISFEEIEVTPVEMSRRILDVSESLPWLVFESDGVVEGYAYASKWRVRSAYRYSVEVSAYLSHAARGKGFGSALYETLLDKLLKLGVHVVIGGIALPNEASIKLHEKMGFQKVAHFAQVGFKNEKWIDVGYWQKIL